MNNEVLRDIFFELKEAMSYKSEEYILQFMSNIYKLDIIELKNIILLN